MQFKAYFLLLIGISFTSLRLSAQTRKEFNTDPKQFEIELRSFFSEDRREESQVIITNFLSLWQGMAFSEEEQQKIIATSNIMLKERYRVNPEFQQYFKFLTSYKNAGTDMAKFNSFHVVLDKLFAGTSRKSFREFTETADLLFSDLTISKNAAKTWKVSKPNFSFDYTTEPVIRFKDVDVMLFTREDTLAVYGTENAEYMPGSEKWEGTKGTVYWTRVGFGREKAYAHLKKYTLDIKSSDYTSDSATFYYPQIFAKPVLGSLQDKANTDYQGENASYPRFRSYQNVFKLKNLFKNIDYQGGFALQGAQILGTGTDTARASISIYQNGKLALRAYSTAFSINPSKIAASKATVSIYLGKDSIYHSQIIFNYQESKRTLTISRDNSGLYASPFFDSYHKFEVVVGNIVWPIDSVRMQMKTIANPGQEALFESADYFNGNKYLLQQKLLSYNPLEKVKRMSDRLKKREISEAELEMEFNNTINNLKGLLFSLAMEGYIFYDVDAHEIVVKDKLIHYVNSQLKNEDYDIIRFNSVISGLPNASLDLSNNDMVLEGVSRIGISDSQNTYFLPHEQKVTLKKNRDMNFRGQVHSGRFDFYGKEFKFDYTGFKVILTDLDSVKFKFPEYDKDSNVIGMRSIANSIQNVNGFLYIDQANNKSGRIPIEKYPIFVCDRESFVYYDQKNIFNGVYKRDNFFFKINPFTINNLDHFTAEGLQFPGSFTSSRIMPVVKHALTIQEDFSLGFKLQSPAEGYPLYEKKGTGKGLFQLSNSGLRATGEVNYLASTTLSDKFIFFPDSMNSNSNLFEIPEKVAGKYPPVKGKNVYNHWMPYKDSMYIYKVTDPIAVYNGKIDFSGSFILTPVELVGNGVMAYQNLNINSSAFAFMPNNIRTRNGNLDIKSESGVKSALTAENITADIDLTKDFGNFHANEDTSKVFLPSNRFATTLNSFTYDIKKKEVDFAKAENQSDEDAYFISNNPEQEKLQFKSTKAQYKISEQNITASNVPFLIVADSKIFTPNNEVQITSGGNLGALKGAEVVTDEKNEYHKIYDAFVNIFSQNKFTGYGSYDYLDKNEKKFTIKFSDIRVDDNGHTIAKGNIEENAKFYLSPRLQYYGPVALRSNRKDLFFDGYVLPDHGIEGLKTEGVKISDTIDPKEVILNIPVPTSRDNKPLFAGTFVNNQSGIYNVFFGKKLNNEDKEIFSTAGVLIYNEEENIFRFGPHDKVLKENPNDYNLFEGPLFEARPAAKEVYTEGMYNLGVDYKNVDFHTAGAYIYDYKANTHNFDMNMIIDFAIGDIPAKMMTDSIYEQSALLQDIPNDGEPIFNAFSMMVKSRKEKDKILADLTANGVIPLTDEGSKRFVLTGVKMHWDDSTRSYISKGNYGMSNANKTIFNKQVSGIIEVKPDKEGDEFNMFLRTVPGSYYYFAYKKGIMAYMSSDILWVDAVGMNAKKTEKGNKGYKLRPGVMDDVYDLLLKEEE